MLIFDAVAAFWLFLAILPVLFLYFLRMRFRRQPIGSVFLWKKLADRTSGGNRLRRRSLLLLALQVASVASLVLALASPILVNNRLVKPGTAILIDVSSSMGAADELDGDGKAITRLDQAILVTAGEIARLPEDAPVAIFTCDSDIVTLSGVVEGKRRAIDALRSIVQGQSGFEEDEVAASIESWIAAREGPWQGILVTDGGLDLGGRRLGAAFGGAFRCMTVGRSAEGLGIGELRLATTDFGTTEAMFLVMNGFPDSRRASVAVAHNGMELARAELLVPSGLSRQSIALPAPASPGAWSASFPGNVDSLAADDACYLAINAARPASVLLAGPGGPYLRAALAYGGITYRAVASLPADITEGEYDLVIADGVQIPASARYNCISFGSAPPDAPLVAHLGASGSLHAAGSGHLVARFVDWRGTHASGGLGFTLRPGAVALAKIGSSIAIAAWQSDGFNRVAFGPDLSASNIGQGNAFPIFMQNVIAWCVPPRDGQASHTFAVGETSIRPLMDEPKLSTPGAIEYRRVGTSLLARAKQPGTFTWTLGNQSGYAAANPPVGELDLAPRTIPTLNEAPTLTADYTSRSRPLTFWAILCLLVFLGAEWLLWRGLPERNRGKESQR